MTMTKAFQVLKNGGRVDGLVAMNFLIRDENDQKARALALRIVREDARTAMATLLADRGAMSNSEKATLKSVVKNTPLTSIDYRFRSQYKKDLLKI